MDKGILIVDIPDNCRVCGWRTVSGFCIGAKRDMYIYGLRNTKPEWCPIKPIPEKEKIEEMYDEFNDGYTIGWNACRAQIMESLGECNE